VGDPGYSIPTTGVGAVHFYDRAGLNSWAPVSDPLLSSDAQWAQKFGYRVALDRAAGRAVATVDPSSTTPRTAYLIELIGGQWQQTGKLTPAGATDLFGSDADLDGGTIVIGDRSYSNRGAGFVWEYNGGAWTGPQILTGSLPSFQDGTASSVAIDENVLVLGAPTAYAASGARPGVAYVFARQNGVWSERIRIVPADLTLRYFGDDVAVSAGIVAAGTYYGSSATPNTGVVYAYDMECCGSELAADFGTNGLWHYDAGWTRLATWDAGSAGLAGWSEGLAVDFETDGLWSYDGGAWQKLTGWNAGEAIEGWSGGLAADFDADGLWNRSGSSWTRLTTWDVGSGGLSSWSGGLAVDFDADGLWSYDGSTWSRLLTSDVTALAGWSGGLALYIPGSGLWDYYDATWSRLSTWSVEGLAEWSGGLAVDFDSNGLWSYDGATWRRLTTWSAETLAGWASGLAVDFGGNGLWSYDGSSWSRLTTWNADGLAAIDLN